MALLASLLDVDGHRSAQVVVGACIGTAVGRVWYDFAPMLESSLGHLVSSSTALVTLLIVGALVVGSIERVLGGSMKRHI